MESAGEASWYWFCGEDITFGNSSSNTTDIKIIRDECTLNVIFVVIHLLFIGLAALILSYRRCNYGKQKSVHLRRRWTGHSLRWILVIILLLLTLASIAEGILSDTLLNGKADQLQLYIPACCFFVAIIISSIYYQICEISLKPAMCLILFVYWMACIAFNAASQGILYKQRVDRDTARVWITFATIFILACLSTLEMVLILSKNCSHNHNIRTRYGYQSLSSSSSDDAEDDVESTKEYISFPSAICFTWINWLLKRGYKEHLRVDDLKPVPDSYTSENAYLLFKEDFDREMKRMAESTASKGFPSIWKVFFRVFKKDIFFFFLTILLHDLASLVGPLALNGIVTYAINYNSHEEIYAHYVTISELFSNGFVLVGVMFIATIVQCFMIQQHLYQCNVIGVHARTALQTMVFDKALHLSSYTISGGSMTVGQITNHVSTDAMNIMYFCQRIHYVWAVPLKITLIMVLLYFQVGMAAFLALALLITSICTLFLIGRIQTRTQQKAMKYSDERLKLCNETLLAMKLLKLYGWEQFFLTAIERVRTLEMSAIMKFNSCYGLSVFTVHAIPSLMEFGIFASYPLISGNKLMPNNTFAAVSLINLIVEPMYFVPMVTSLSVSAFVAVGRLQKFFVAPELQMPLTEGDSGSAKRRNTYKRPRKLTTGSSADETTRLLAMSPIPMRASVLSNGNMTNYNSNIEDNKEPTQTSETAIQFTEASFTWGNNNEPVLEDITLKIPRGEVTVIVGAVGSGKSSLLSAILGEMTLMRGSVRFEKCTSSSGVAYAGQSAWLMNASLRENILFGQPYKRNRYRKVIDASALAPDIAILPGGDKTEIGEKGINLSGGQKQRISVARAMYSDKDIILFDDPLSALDVNVGSHLFFKGILGRLKISRRTVVIVTHQLQYLQHADKIVVMKKGRITAEGTIDDIALQDKELYRNCQEQIIAASEYTGVNSGFSGSETEMEMTVEERRLLQKQVSLVQSKYGNSNGVNNGSNTGNLIQEEELGRGSVPLKVYMYYIRNMGLFWAFAFLLSSLAMDGFISLADIWLSDWSEAGLGNTTVRAIYDDYAPIYAVYICCSVLAAAAFSLAAVISTLLAAKVMHVNMLRTLLRSPIRFFDTTPLGRILNRLANDTQIIDTKLLITLLMLLHFFSSLVFAFIVNTIVTPIFILEVLPIIVIFWILAVYFITSSRELQRLDSITRSPALAQFSETLGGLTTIRAYRDQERFFNNFHSKIDTNNAAFLYLKASYGWLGLRLSLCGAILVFLVGLTTLIQAIKGNIASSDVGLAISYVLMVSTYMYDFVQGATGTEMQMNPVERVQYYTTLPTESDEGAKPGRDWPERGEVKISNVSVRYVASLPPVLKGISLHVKAGEKIGICGRTGSGKSSLTLALFRLIETFQGEIIIDGIDISTLPLTTLRQRLSIIPQDPVLFTGTIRSNLDPCSEKMDTDLWRALEISQLKDTLLNNGFGLDSLVSEGGENFSMGQRQLFCLARAFLRNSRILVMDEATASIDYDTERVLQSVVSSAFHDKTVLTIAHRVSTILESDTIWVLDEGQIIECDSPQNLLARRDSAFYAIVQANK
ncbi:ATP-binding cassette sub-family C member 9-like isoform X2 [Amphiura filiformis]|uniref:ATP-binding cassette sub-family C member 9-like isoform X2 n=1 Tax=Amphiura filiformis TaxID=82378 RepID=UPI003B2176CA